MSEVGLRHENPCLSHIKSIDFQWISIAGNVYFNELLPFEKLKFDWSSIFGKCIFLE